MAKQQYRIATRSKWMGASGNAILALYNVPGSGKKLTITSVEIYNNNQLGRGNAADTVSNINQMFRFVFASTLAGGETVPLSKMNSSASAFPSTVQVKTRTGFTPELINWNGTTTYTDGTVAAGDTTFTPDSAPSWLASEHYGTNRYLVVSSGSNAGQYRIIANSTTALTLEHGLPAAGSTTGYIAQPKALIDHGLVKVGIPSNSMPPLAGSGYSDANFEMGGGAVFRACSNSNVQPITIRAGEKLVFFAESINNSFPMMVEATIVRSGSPNRTYKACFFHTLDSNQEAILTIDNNTGSGEVIYLTGVSVSELGTLDTPYFQLVPFGGISPASFDDSEVALTAVPTNSTYGALAGTVAKVFTNVPVLPYGVPQSYIALGAPAAAVPRGFNYLNSKDFIGPVYMTYFPEAAAFKTPATAAFTLSPPGTFGSHLSQSMGVIKGCGTSGIVVREGEAIGIVSGAETATAATAVPISGFGSYEFCVTFSVENATSPALTFTGLKDNTEIRIFDHTTGTELAGIENATTGTENNRSFSWEYEYSTGLAVDVMLVSLGYQIIRFDNLALTTTGIEIPIQQTTDRWYSNS